jgi:transposase InsO family protein
VSLIHLKRKVINFYETQSNKKVVSLMSDRGGEYIAQEHLDWLEGRGTIVTKTPGYTPELNGAAEKLGRTLTDRANAILHDMSK